MFHSFLVFFSAIFAIVVNAREASPAHPEKHIKNLVSELHAVLYNGFNASKSDHRRLQIVDLPVVNVNQYYIETSYFIPPSPSNPSLASSCSSKDTAMTAYGRGLGCVSFAGVPPPSGASASDMPGSMQLTCYNVNGPNSGGVAFGATLFSGNTCNGDQVNLADSLLKAFNSVMSSYSAPACSVSSTGYSAVANCAGSFAPASLYKGYRVAKFSKSSTCMGNPDSFSDFYDYNYKAFPGYAGSSAAYSCAGGTIYTATDGKSPSYTNTVTCTTQSFIDNTIYESAECVSAMDSLTTRTFVTWTMYDIVNGVTLSDWNSNPQFAVAFVSAAAAVYGIAYSSISAISASNGPVSSSVQVSYTIFLQPGFGNSYAPTAAATAVFNDINAKHTSAIASSCSQQNSNPCMTDSLRSFAIQTSLPGFNSMSVDSSPPSPTQPQTTTISSPPAPTGMPPGPTLSASSSKKIGMIVGIVIGVLVLLGGVGFYFWRQKSTQAALAAADANANVKNPIRV